MTRVFISYARKNQGFAEQLADDLRAYQFPVWIDLREIQPGEEWRRAITKGILQADGVVVCLSVHAVESEWVRREIFLATSLEKKVVPIMIEDCFEILKHHEETKRLLDVQILHFEQNYNDGLLALLQALGRVPPDNYSKPITIVELRRLLRSLPQRYLRQ